MPSDLQRDECLHDVPASCPQVSLVSAAVRDALAHQAATAPAAVQGSPSLMRWSTIGSMSAPSAALPLLQPSTEVLPGATATLAAESQQAPGQLSPHNSTQDPAVPLPLQQPTSTHQSGDQHPVMSSNVFSDTLAAAERNDDDLLENLSAVAPPLLQPHLSDPLQQNQQQPLHQEAHQPEQSLPGADMSCHVPVDGSERSHIPMPIDASMQCTTGGSGVAGFNPP